MVTGEELAGYLTDRKRRSHFHPELQAEIEFGIEQSTNVDATTISENFKIFLEHDEDWERANEGILEARDRATQAPFPAMTDLERAVSHEIAWQKAMWDSDYANAFEAAREVLGNLNEPLLRGYRALWHYLAGSAARLAVEDGDTSLQSLSVTQFRQAKEASSGITWLIGLARGGSTAPPTAKEQDQATVMLQVERLEAQLQKLGTLHNRDFSSRERDIREGLKSGKDFEAAQVLLGQHVGFAAGKRETDASPDPWWQAGDVVIVFEDHANAGADAVIDAKKARQAASHPDWVREHVPGAASATIRSVLITPAEKAKEGAAPHLSRVSYWRLEEFRVWAGSVLQAVRELRRTFTSLAT